MWLFLMIKSQSHPVWNNKQHHMKLPLGNWTERLMNCPLIYVTRLVEFQSNFKCLKYFFANPSEFFVHLQSVRLARQMLISWLQKSLINHSLQLIDLLGFHAESYQWRQYFTVRKMSCLRKQQILSLFGNDSSSHVDVSRRT